MFCLIPSYPELKVYILHVYKRSLEDHQAYYTLPVDVKLTISEVKIAKGKFPSHSFMYYATLEDEYGTKYLLWLQEYVAGLVKGNKWFCNITYHGYDNDPIWTISKKNV